MQIILEPSFDKYRLRIIIVLDTFNTVRGDRRK